MTDHVRTIACEAGAPERRGARRWRGVVTGFLCIVGVVDAPLARPQERDPRLRQAPPPPAHDFVVELQVRDRWLHRRSFVPSIRWLPRDYLVTVDSIVQLPSGTGRRLYVREGDPWNARHPGTIELRGGGPPVVSATFTPSDWASNPQDHRQRRISLLWRLLPDPTSITGLSLPSERLLDLIPTFRPRGRRVGERWQDTIRWRDAYDSLSQELVGVRTSWLEADSSRDGRERWLVRDSAVVRYVSRFESPTYDRDADAEIRQRLAGTIVGRVLYDVTLQLPVWRRDSTSWSGESSLTEPEERRLVTAARYDRVREWRWRTPAEHVAWREAWLLESERTSSGPVGQPGDSLQVRLAARDTVLRDSLERAFMQRPPSAERDSIRATLLWASTWSPGLTARLSRQQVADGDTLLLLSMLADRHDDRAARFDVPDIRMLLDWLEHPQRLWDIGLPRHTLTSPWHSALVDQPLALRDTSQWVCTPAACELLISRGQRSRLRGVRDLALLARFSRDPVAEAPSLRAAAMRNATAFRGAPELLDGVGATGASSSKPTAPAVGSGWRPWLEWMEGGSHRVVARTTLGRAGTRLSPPSFGDSHRNALRIHALVSGRAFERELQLAFERADGDSARLIFGTLRNGLRTTPVPADTVLAWFQAGSPPMQALARAEVTASTDHSRYASSRTWTRQPVDSALRDSLLGRLLEGWATGRSSFRTIEAVVDSARGVGSPRPSLDRRRPPPTRDAVPVTLLADDWPKGLPARWRGVFPMVTSAELARKPVTEAYSVQTLPPPQRVGPYIILELGGTGQLARPAGAARRQVYSNLTLTLLEYHGEWVIVASDTWIT